MQHPAQRATSRLAIALLVASVAFIAALTLRPAAGGARGPLWACVLCGERGAADLILNVVLFLPFGAALARLGVRPLITCGLALLFSGSLEAAQSFIPGRFPTGRDIVLNAAGAWLGALVALNLARWIASRWSPLLFATAVASLPGTVLVSGWLLQPAVRQSAWFGQPTPRLAHLDIWAGRLDTARLDALPIRNGFLPNSGEVQRAVMARSSIVLTGKTAPPPRRLAAILAIADESSEEMLLVGQEGHDLIFRERRRASEFRLFEPEARLRDVFLEAPAGTPFRLVVSPGRTESCATLNGRHNCAPRLAAGSAWSLLVWRRGLSPDTHRLLSALTLLVLGVPIGLLATRGSPRAAAAEGSAVLAALVLVSVASGVTALAPPSPTEWLGAILGIASGAGMRHAMRPRAHLPRASGAPS